MPSLKSSLIALGALGALELSSAFAPMPSAVPRVHTASIAMSMKTDGEMLVTRRLALSLGSMAALSLAAPPAQAKKVGGAGSAAEDKETPEEKKERKKREREEYRKAREEAEREVTRLQPSIEDKHAPSCTSCIPIA